MVPILDWIKGALDSIANWTKDQWSRVLVAAIIIMTVWRMVIVEGENKVLRIENRNFNTECNIIINNVKDSMGKKIDSLQVAIYIKELAYKDADNKTLQETVNELKKLKENVNRVKRINDKIIKERN